MKNIFIASVIEKQPCKVTNGEFKGQEIRINIRDVYRVNDVLLGRAIAFKSKRVRGHTVTVHFIAAKKPYMEYWLLKRVVMHHSSEKEEEFGLKMVEDYEKNCI